MATSVTRTDQEWQQHLTPEQFEVMRRSGTERAFSGRLLNNHADGTYHCAACDTELFSSTTKFESGSGWPSFTEPANRAHVDLVDDSTHGMRRTEVRCATCGSHLGHVFDDGPRPTGQRYCMNSVALEFKEGEATG